MFIRAKETDSALSWTALSPPKLQLSLLICRNLKSCLFVNLKAGMMTKTGAQKSRDIAFV